MYKYFRKTALQLVDANYLSKVGRSRDFVSKILTRLLKERAKRKSAEDQTNDSLFLRDTLLVPKSVVLDPGEPKKTESVHPVSIETPSSLPVPLENVSLPVPAEVQSKEKPSAPLKANGNGEKANGEIIRKAEDSARKGSVSIAVIPPSSMQSNLQPDTASSSSTHPASNTVLNFFKSLPWSFLLSRLVYCEVYFPYLLSYLWEWEQSVVCLLTYLLKK